MIIKDVTIKGAGADLVSIRPRHTTPPGGQIADSAPNIRNAIGEIVMINGDDTQTRQGRQRHPAQQDKTKLLNVNISGVTIDGDGVYAEAGIVFRDASGTITRSRDHRRRHHRALARHAAPGEYKGSNDGVAVASVDRRRRPSGGQPDTGPLPTTPRRSTIDHTRIDKYNSPASCSTARPTTPLPLIASGVMTRATLTGEPDRRAHAVHRLHHANGNCSSRPAPAPATNGPLYGQDGVRVTAGSSATLTDNTITQNLVQGTGAPTRGTRRPTTRTCPRARRSA